MANKPGRNDPCPCGSGKKYKKCCWGKERAFPAPEETDEREPAFPGAEALRYEEPEAIYEPEDAYSDFHPYVIARMVERHGAAVIKDMSPEERERFDKRWTRLKVLALSTEEICRRLQDLKIDPSPETFLSLARGTYSAWEIGDVWAARLDRRQGDFLDDFVCFAACELWKRYCPARPSMEMLDDWMQEGYDSRDGNPPHCAIELWQRVWDALRPRFTSGMRECADALKVFNGYQSLFNWCTDFIETLLRVAHQNAEYARLGIRFCEEFLAQFPDESPLLLESTQSDMATFLFFAGQKDRGEAIFQEMIRDFPYRANGYVCWADALCLANPSRQDMKQALDILKQAQDRPVLDAVHWDLDERIKQRKEEIERITAKESQI
ncbi:MAG: SEC-C metal-binding domain-containing protein [Candidatus Sumerlaeota bacterium]|nr:SEC-C metal-binding domain-containing protein [Candidatus Sumerlaeota bacterium]